MSRHRSPLHTHKRKRFSSTFLPPVINHRWKGHTHNHTGFVEGTDYLGYAIIAEGFAHHTHRLRTYDDVTGPALAVVLRSLQ